MTDFVLSQENKGMQNTDRHLRFDKVLRYANFLKQPLTLSMFIPCDLDGNILGEPIRGFEESDKDYLEFVKAKERVLFKGYVVEYNCVKSPCGGYLDIVRLKDRTIENIIGSNLELTESAIKKLGL